MLRATLTGGVACLCIGCGAAAPSEHIATRTERPPAPIAAGDCRASAVPATSARASTSRQGSTVALARRGDDLVAYAADSDGRSVNVVDVARREQVSVPIDGAPEQILVLADGRVLVTVSDADRVEVYEPAASGLGLVKRCARHVPVGPFGLAAAQDDKTVVVTSAWASSIAILAGEELSLSRVVDVPRAPRGVALEGDRAFVSHLAGSGVSVVDLDGGKVRRIGLELRAASPVGTEAHLETYRSAGQAYALASVTTPAGSGERGALPSGAGPAAAAPRAARPGRIVVPMVSIDPGDERRGQAMYYGPPPLQGVPKHAPVGAVLDARAERMLSTHVLASTWDLRAAECNLPRAIAVDERTGRGFVACMGIDQVQVVDVTAADPMSAVLDRFAVPAGPTGVAITTDGGTMVVFAEHASRLHVVDLASRRADDVALPVAGTNAFRRGRELFYASDDRGVSFDGMACASCHPDGGDDGLTWSTPEGPRQTPMLAGRLVGTAPYGWDRGSPDLEAYVEETVRRLRGRGLSRLDLQALASYVERMPAPPTRAPSELAATGRDIFFAQGCAICHEDAGGTDRRLHAVDVGTNAVDTPSLRFVGSTAPYLHDGRYASLESLLTHSEMGSVESLNAYQRSALVAFLESL